MSTQDKAGAPVVAQLPVVAAPPERRRHPRGVGAGLSAFMAQMLGQGGARRGVRGGPPAVDAAQTAYREAEWSGGADRRTPCGGLKRTEV